RPSRSRAKWSMAARSRLPSARCEVRREGQCLRWRPRPRPPLTSATGASPDELAYLQFGVCLPVAIGAGARAAGRRPPDVAVIDLGACKSARTCRLRMRGGFALLGGFGNCSRIWDRLDALRRLVLGIRRATCNHCRGDEEDAAGDERVVEARGERDGARHVRGEEMLGVA